MRKDFCIFILTHGRPNNIKTWEILDEFKYTGERFLIVDSLDKTLPEYKKKYKDKVIVFSKEDAARKFDEGDNFRGLKGVVYARNVCFDIARDLGFKYFSQFDDDYSGFYLRFNSEYKYGVWRAECLNEVFENLIQFLEKSSALSVCMSQGGDHIGGGEGSFGEVITARRKAMNTFVCSVDRPFQTPGRMNEDVNLYTGLGFRGNLFFTIVNTQVNQIETQKNPGGMTEAYLETGTYIKTFYSVLRLPSCIKVSTIGNSHLRIHHKISWNNCVPMILRENHRKPRPDQALQM